MSYYAVKAGHTTGIFNNWPECQKATQGFSGAIFQKFATMAEAEAFMADVDIYGEMIKRDIGQGYVVAFCDGSYDQSKNRYSYGVLIIDQKLIQHEIYGSEQNPKYIASNNIIGEVRGAINAMDWAITNGYEKLKIYHDYEGLSKWLSGEWKVESEVGKMYLSLYKTKFEDVIQVTFEKVKGHSNNRYNDKADELAKRAITDNTRVPVSGDSWFIIPYFKEVELQTIFDLISEDYSEIQIDRTVNANSIIYKLALDKNKLFVTLFKSGNRKLLVQGANTILFQVFVTYVNELIGVKEERVFADAYRQRIDTVKIDTGMKDVCPVFPTDYPDNIKRLIRQALINLSYYVESEDYSQYVFPALRALEGHMKYLFGRAGITIISKQGFCHFEKEPVTKIYYLPPKIVADAELKRKLEEYYNYYNTIRNTVFHFGDITGATDSTWIIETKSEADEHIKKCLSYICEE